MKSKRFDKYVAMQEGMESLIELKPMRITQRSDYIDWIRTSVVGHLDGLCWRLLKFSDKDRRNLAKNIRVVFPDMGKGGSYEPEEYEKKPKIQWFMQRRKLENKYIQIFIDWKRDWKRSPDSPIEGEVRLFWKDKFNYSGYHAVAEMMEQVITVTQVQSWLGYAEIALDTLVPAFAEYIHGKTLLRKVRQEQYFHWSNDAHLQLAGIDPSADGWYQGAEFAGRQLHGHMITNQPVDKKTGRHLYRLELRLREIRKSTPIGDYGPNSVKTVIEHQERIIRDNIMWREPNPDKMSQEDVTRFTGKPVVYWVYSLIQRTGTNKVPHRDARRSYVREAKALPVKYL